MANKSSRPQPPLIDPPEPDVIKAARAAAGMTQEEAGKVIYAHQRSWFKWESGERKMHPAFFQLFIIKTRQPKWPPS